MVYLRHMDSKLMESKGKAMLRLSLSVVLAAVTAVSAQLKFNLGPVPYTMQNFGIVLSGLILGRYGAVAQLIYLGMIAAGIPAASGFKGGIGVLFGFTSGYLWAFPIAAFLVGIAREKIWKNGSRKELFLLWLSSCLVVIPVYLLGFYVFYKFATGSKLSPLLMKYCKAVESRLGLRLSPFWMVFLASVVIFIPQDYFMDHVLAVIAFAYVDKMMRERGIEL